MDMGKGRKSFFGVIYPDMGTSGGSSGFQMCLHPLSKGMLRTEGLVGLLVFAYLYAFRCLETGAVCNALSSAHRSPLSR